MPKFLIWPLLAVALIALPHGLSFSQQEILVFLTINVLLVSSYRLLTLTGEWSLGHVVIMGVGAYASALFTKELGIWVPASMLLGGVIAALIAVTRDLIRHFIIIDLRRCDIGLPQPCTLHKIFGKGRFARGNSAKDEC